MKKSTNNNPNKRNDSNNPNERNASLIANKNKRFIDDLDTTLDTTGKVIPAIARNVDAPGLDIASSRGAAVSSDGTLFFIEPRSRKIRKVKPNRNGRFNSANATDIDLPNEIADPVGLAVTPNTDRLFVVDQQSDVLYELSPEGAIVTKTDLADIGLRETTALAIAPSLDSTDDPDELSLFVADSSEASGGIVEVSLQAAATPPSVPVITPTLIRTIQASLFSPPSPDTSGIVYRPSTNSLIAVDSEVNEIATLFSGVNTWEIDLDGNPVLNTGVTVGFSGEPTGISYNPANGHFFISDDVARDIFEVDPGADGLIGGGDDSVTAFDTVAFGSADPEGVAFVTLPNGQSSLFIVDGLNSEVYQTSLTGQLLNQFDTESSGIFDPEGIVYDPARDRLLIVGDNPVVGEFTTTGTLTGYFDISEAQDRKAAGLALGPSSSDSSQTSLYITDRGRDNNTDPDENDGKIYEFLLPPADSADLALEQVVDNPTPQAGESVTFTLTLTNESNQTASGVAVTDNLPAELSFVSANASQGSFNAGNGQWTVGTLAAGASVNLEITANVATPLTALVTNTAEVTASNNPDPDSTPGNGVDGEDDLASVSVGPPVISRSFAVSASSDDAEENIEGRVSRTSSDLELTTDSTAQTVGIRFAAVDIPEDITITNAYIQFQTDEVSTGSASLTIRGEDQDNALTFSNTNQISTRQTTAAATAWNPAPWTTSGEADVDQRTPDLSAVIQEIINRPGWVSGNAIATIFTGSGVRIAESFDGTAAPELVLEYIDNRQPGADIELTQSIAEPAANVGDQVTFNLAVTNQGPDTTNDLVVEDLLPTGFTFDSATASQGSYSSSTGLWSLGTLGNGSSANLSLVGTAASAGSFTNTAEVISSSVDDPDSTPNNGIENEDDQASVDISVFSAAENILDIAIAASSDDAEENSQGKVSQTSSDLELVTDRGNAQTVGLRFLNVALPDDAVITRAYVQFQTDEVSTGTADLTIRGEDQDNPLTYSNANQISTRPTTSASALWTPDPWTVIGESSSSQQTADLSAVVQEIIDRPGWVSGNALSLIITGTGSRVAESFNGSAPPTLRLEFSTPNNLSLASSDSPSSISSALSAPAIANEDPLLSNQTGATDTTASSVSLQEATLIQGISDSLSTSTLVPVDDLVVASPLSADFSMLPIENNSII